LKDFEKEKSLLEEIEAYREEREKIKKLLGHIGGKNYAKNDRIINYIFLGIVITLFILEIFTHWLPTYVSLEVAILLISIKIVWLIHNISRMSHFQFWILNSIEFRINTLSKKIDEIQIAQDSKG